MNKPLEKQLTSWLKQQKSACGYYLNLVVILGLLTGFSLIIQAYLISTILHGIIILQQPKSEFTTQFFCLIALIPARALLAFARERCSFEAGKRLRLQVRSAVLDKLSELRTFLSEHIDLQVKFIILRLENAIPNIIAQCSKDQRVVIHRHLSELTATPEGIFTLLDYVNFKGEGLSIKERYQGEGWGLKQVLLTMPKQYDNARRAFGLAADEVLTRRVKNAPRDEFRWLKGWRIRIHGYQAIEL